MTAFELLSEPIRKYVRDQRWEKLRPIQDTAIQRIIASDNNYVLISRTASGKTEAAFLPILSKVNFNENGVKVLYISPLIALINDQFVRIEELCEYLDINVTKWHGEANKTQKERLIKNPNGIVLITPESIEAMFVNRPYQVKHLFSNLDYVVIDEVHSFIGSDRGTQLKSLLSRLQSINNSKFSIVGLSATMSDVNSYLEIKEFLGDSENTKILRDKTPKPIKSVFRFFKSDTQELPLELLKDLYIETKNNKVLIFPNSRGRVEEIAVKLKKISERVGGHKNYFSHHSSVDREVREYIEFFAKNNKNQNFCISCTSTLELGIDIGSIDEVVQIDSTHSIASLIQRVGRSGRRDDEPSNLFLYTTDGWSLLQSLACWLLYKEEYIEPPRISEKPYDILLHQILSIIKGTSGILQSQLIEQIHKNFAFSKIEVTEIEEIVKHLIEIDFIEKLGNELILGIEGEKVVNNKEFYSVFKTESLFKVSHKGSNIGEIPLSPQVREDENLYLSARIWKIIFIDLKAKKIEVIPANDGKKPLFEGNSGDIDSAIREKMLEILVNKNKFDVLDKPSEEKIQELQKTFSIFQFTNTKIERPLLQSENKLFFFSMTSSRINRTLLLIFEYLGIKSILNEVNSSFDISNSKEEFLHKIKNLNIENFNFENEILNKIQTNPAILDFTKWGGFLPDKYKIKLCIDSRFYIDKTVTFLKEVKIVSN